MKRDVLEMIKYAYRNVPIYEEKKQIVSEVEDISEIPVLKKEELMEDWEQGINRKYLIAYLQGKLASSWTSGSTGACLRVLWKKEQFNQSLFPLWILRYRFYKIYPSDRFCYFYNTPNIEQKQQGNICYEIVDNSLGFYKENLLEENVVQIIEMMREYKPTWLMLQPSIALHLAEIIVKKNIPKLSTVTCIELYGEMLLDESRNFIEKVFQCKVVNQYGCNEVNSIAYECPYGHLHCLESNVYVEIVNSGKIVSDGCEGEICLTTLTNRVMPFIRYLIGDYGVMEHQHTCKCGLRSPILRLKTGRVGTWIRHEDGTVTTPYIFVHAVNSVVNRMGDVIIQFRVTQKEYKRFQTVFVLVEDAYEKLEFLEKEIENTFINCITDVMMLNGEYEFIYTNHIISAKYLKKNSYFVSEI